MNSRSLFVSLSTSLGQTIRAEAERGTRPGAAQASMCISAQAGEHHTGCGPARKSARRPYVMMPEGRRSRARKMSTSIRILGKLSLAIWLTAAGAVTVSSQVVPPAGAPDQKPSPSVAGPAAPADQQAVDHTLAQPAYLTPIAGYQGVLAETI